MTGSAYENKAYDGDNPIKVSSFYMNMMHKRWLNIFHLIFSHHPTQRIQYQFVRKSSYPDLKNGGY